MVRTCIDGFQVPLPALVEFLIFVGYKGVNLPLQTIGSMSAEKFLQKFSLHVCLIPDGPKTHGVEPNLSLVLQSQREKLQPHQIHIGDVSLKVLHTSSNSQMCE